MNYHNEHDPGAAEWIRELIREGLIPKGEVDERSIKEVQPAELAGFRQAHFFAGISGWSEALQLAGWPEGREVWTGSCPCQPYSTAGSKKGTTTHATYGPTSSASSASAALSQSLANKLKEQFGTVGSMEYQQTWKEKATPLGRVYWAHTASGRRTSGNDCIGWQTPAVADGTGGHLTRGGKRSSELLLPGEAITVPRATDGENGGPNQSGGALSADAALTGWATPTVSEKVRSEEFQKGRELNVKETLVGWATPTAQDHSRGVNPPRPTDTGVPLSQMVSGLTRTQSSAGITSIAGYRLNPAFPLWLQGFPAAWVFSGVRAMQSVSQRRRHSSKRSSKRKVESRPA